MLAGWIGRSRGVIVDADQIIVTSGAQEAIHLVVRTMLRPGDPIAVEDPGYPPVRLLFEAIGLRVVPVPVDGEGIVVDQIPADVKVVYTTPSHQSPSGVTMSLGRRRALLAFADRHDAAIIEDDYDSEFRHTDRPLEPLHRLDRSGRVAYVGTFSKTLSPSLRLGFVAMPDPLVDAATAWRRLFSVQPSSLGQLTLHRFIEQGHLDRHLRRVSRVYRTRHEIVRQFVADGVDAGVLLPGPENHAGLHLSTVLPAGVSEDADPRRCPPAWHRDQQLRRVLCRPRPPERHAHRLRHGRAPTSSNAPSPTSAASSSEPDVISSFASGAVREAERRQTRRGGALGLVGFGGFGHVPGPS